MTGVLFQRHQTALHVAVENGFSDVVEILLVAGADIEAKEKVRHVIKIYTTLYGMQLPLNDILRQY